MTSVAFSPMLGHWIGLGVIARGPQRIGERVRAYDPVRNGDVEVEICNPVFFDPGRSAAPWLALRRQRSALHGIAVPGHYGRAGATGVVIEELHRPRASPASSAKRGKRFALINAVEHGFRRGAAGRAAPGHARACHVRRCAGPDQWIASAEGADAAGFAARVRARIGPFAAVSDQSDARLVLRVSGPRVRDVLAKGVPRRPASQGVQAGRHRVHGGRLHRHADRHARRGDLSARRAAQHGGQFLVVAHGLRGRVRLRSYVRGS